MPEQTLQLLISLLVWLAVPVVLVAAYDKWVLAPKRPRSPEGVVAPGPVYTRVANFLVPFVILAVVLRIGVSLVFDWAGEVAVPLSWIAIPVAVWAAIDSWLLAPRRKIAAGSVDAPDPPFMRALYFVLPVFVIAPIVRMIRAETLDFSLVLLLLSVFTGAIWAIDHFVFRKRRELAAAAAKPNAIALPEPGTVDYARSFFPVAFVVLIVRAFIFEPFRIPSDSMMPTLLDGDFIVVNKFAYGLRWPVLNEKFLETGTPQRGDVVVFRYPPNPSVNYIKRLVGLPGDRIEVRGDHLVINGQLIPQEEKGTYSDGCYLNFGLSSETLGEHTHQVLACRSPTGWRYAQDLLASGDPQLRQACDRKKIRESFGGYLCDGSPSTGLPDSNDYVFQDVVPAGHYLMIGDNRDNSQDSRVWSYVPDKNVVGKATRIWFNFDLQRQSVVNWSRIGDGIQ
jgi:signal peptidase I